MHSDSRPLPSLRARLGPNSIEIAAGDARMSLLFRIVYAAHAKGTHHKLALDALRQLDDANAEGWQRLFLKHADLYMDGAKAPDDQFKDFKNHVLHVRDGYWGGAMDKAEKWYGELTEALKRRDWEQAVWNAGVLSHYVTDPIQPFHTGQSDAENSIHRAAEWSISRSYDALRAEGLADHGPIRVPAGDGAIWLRDLVCRGAEKANPHYETLIAHYNLTAGVVDPPAGLDLVSRRILGELIVYAAGAFATVLDRAFAEAAVTPPEISLTLETVLAAVKIPAKMLAKRLADAEDRRVVTAMFDELTATGRVDATLPEDDRVVRTLYEAEIAAPRRAEQTQERAAAVSGAAKKAPPAAAPRPKAAGTPAAIATLVPGGGTPKFRLALGDAIERAPSIGPKMAEKLAPLGIRTVADFLAASAYLTADSLRSRHVKADTILLWQDQCRLMLEIPELRGTHAELLAGAGYRTAKDLATADEAKLCADVLAFATTPPGQRLLRDGAPPDIERIKGWLLAAKAIKAA
jgi:predicted flap endonuclease-1-like 5' DNA nuclease